MSTQQTHSTESAITVAVSPSLRTALFHSQLGLNESESQHQFDFVSVDIRQ